MAVYLSLFFNAFLAATVFPWPAEPLLVALLLAGKHAPWLLVMIASAGNVLGAVVNWGLGRGVEKFHHEKWFPVRPRQLHRAQNWYSRYGRWSLLLSWVPLLGDPLTLTAGIMREKLWVFVALVAAAKTARYTVVMLMTLKFF